MQGGKAEGSRRKISWFSVVCSDLETRDLLRVDQHNIEKEGICRPYDGVDLIREGGSHNWRLMVA